MNSDLLNRIALISVILIATCFTEIVPVVAQNAEPSASQLPSLPTGAVKNPAISNDGVDAYQKGRTVWLHPTQTSIKAGQVHLTRVCATIRSMQWTDDPKRELKISPVASRWGFSWKAPVDAQAMIKLVFESDPILPSDRSPAEPAGDGSVMLFAHQAMTFGEKILFEPQWYKNTVGYWTIPTDYATWKLNLQDSGVYSVAVLQGCGKGQGGSQAVISLRQGETTVTELPFQTVDTGHFQNFRWNHLGNIAIESAGNYELRIDATKIAKVALFDVRMIHLVKQAE